MPRAKDEIAREEEEERERLNGPISLRSGAISREDGLRRYVYIAM